MSSRSEINSAIQVSFVPTVLDASNTVVSGEGLNKLTVNHETGFILW
jgi:hypothetical protein